MPPISVERVGWYPTAEGIRPSNGGHFRTSLSETEDVVDEK